MGMTTRQQTAIQASIYSECSKLTKVTDSIAGDIDKIEENLAVLGPAYKETIADLRDAIGTIRTAQRQIRQTLPRLF